MKKFKFTISGNNYDVDIMNYENNIMKLEVNGTPYKVEVHREVQKVSATKTPTLVRARVPEPKTGEKKIKKNISTGAGKPVLAPLPGTILKVLVSNGDEVKRGDNLMIMEAMKMENNILSEKDGIVGSIKVAEGDTVLQNDVLLEIA